MAISYASGMTADHTPALPSFRELLPPHLHDEIESTSYFASRQNPHTRERPLSASFDLTPTSRSLSDRLPYATPSKLPLADDFRPGEAFPRDSSSPLHSRLAGNPPQSASASTRFTSRGPSPILPSIRDLQSLPERGMSPSSSAFSESRGLSRPEYAAQDFRAGPMSGHGFPATNISGPLNDRRSADSFMGGAGPHSLPNQVAYPYPTMAYQSDSEQVTPQSLSHAQQSNFGILGDPIDSKNKRRRGNLPKPVTDILRAWFHEHLDHPYPSEEDKQMFMTRTGLTISQISNWFINARRRQLPALRNQMRNGGNDLDSQRQSPFSDVEHTSPESMPSPHMGTKP
ncbi:homeobox domain-containing protein [Aspergillus fijiensis CBS 313.89]|uniref:Homeobox transcription factor n=1 Tax=Aspergillus fijiensis CBS 313.89 TaxID=1448319 RepID=A0A8G1W3N9_9EURO|nr:homeobox transcription factor [Aspergillus fijiensis CBS 313.89]RAK82637.1 homeobox transcription factor [Aspergillus fijiensis CBS 313.89]